MIPDLFLKEKKRIELVVVPATEYNGLRLPGSVIYRYQDDNAIITVQESINPLFIFGYRLFRFLKKIKLAVFEKNGGLLLKAVLSGEFHVTDTLGKKIRIRTGQYFISDQSQFTHHFKKGIGCSFFLIHYSKDLLTELGFDPKLQPQGPLFLNDKMKDLIHDILHNPYDENLRNFFYENSVRELLFLHLSNPKASLPGVLTDSDIAKVYHADSIILQNLNSHFSIRELSRMAGTNEFKLKKGFRQVFGMGVFSRLLERRMTQARQLLETTDKPIWEIGELTGYDTLAGFIKAFRKKFGKTPRQWRMQKNENE
jgi:AraC-like DNA-binding protein